MTERPAQLVILVPVFNEGERLLGVLDGICRSAGAWNCTWRTVVLDDGSGDWTEETDRRLGDMPQVSVRHFACNRGKGAVLSDAFQGLDGDWCVVIDADGEYAPGDIQDLLAPIKADQADFVFGSRYGFGRHRPRQYVMTYLANQLFNLTFGLLSGVWLNDLLTGLYAFRVGLVRDMRLKECRFSYTPELLWRIQRRWRPRWEDVPVDYHFRTYGEGKNIRWWEVFTILGALVRYRFAPLPSGAPRQEGDR